MSDSIPIPVDLPAPEGPVDLLLVAGEHSGDEHAAELVAELRARDPNLRVACLGGVRLQAAGAQLLYDLTAVSIVGFVEVLRHYGFFKSLFDRTVDWIERHRPRQICFVDYPGFNLRLAERLRRRGLSRKGGGSIALSYYIGPQIWAWKAKRRFQMEATLDRLGVIFPFEVDCFADTGLPVEFVGHPFAKSAHRLPFVHAKEAPALLLPGSRRQAVGRIFPLLLAGFREALADLPDLRARVVYPSEGIRRVLEAVLAQHADLKERVELVEKDDEPLPASAVLMSSGTMSLSVALSGIPGAIVYRLNPLSYWLGRALVRIDYIGISNLLLKRPLHPEYIQGAAQPKALGAELSRALREPKAAAEAAAGASELRELLRPDHGTSAADWLERGLRE